MGAKWLLALGIAGIADALDLFFDLPADATLVGIPITIALDAGVMVALMSLMENKSNWWSMLPALIVEAIPGIGLFPTWAAVVIGMKNKF